MNTFTPQFLARSKEAFAANLGFTMQDLRARIAERETGTRRRDLLSALDIFARLFKRDLASIPATAKALRSLLASKNAAQLGIADKHYANVRSCLVAAIRDHGETPLPVTKRVPLTTEWSALLLRIQDPSYRFAFNRLASFCSFMGIPPTEVTQEALIAFLAALEAEEIVKNPRKLLKHTIASWNMCRRQVEGWPDIVLSSPFKKAPLSRPLAAFPKNFQDDLGRWIERLSNPDILEPDALARPLRPITIEGHAAIILRAASILVHLGRVPIKEITSLGVLTGIENHKAILRFLLERSGNKPTAYVARVAQILRAVARHHCRLDETALKQLSAIGRVLERREPRQMTPKNRERLRQFDDPENVARLLAFPEEERRRGLKQKNPLRRAKCFERALAVALFIYGTLRIQTLRTINMQTDIIRVDGKTYLSIDGSKVKNGMNLEFELPGEVATLLDEYVRDHRPKLAGSEGPYLFPGRDGGPRSHSTMRQDFIGVMRKRAGLVMHPRLVRHTISKVVIERDPSMALAMSRQLGHKRQGTMYSSYLGTEGRAASRHVNKLLADALANPKLKKE